jgi:hypothetical protein
METNHREAMPEAARELAAGALVMGSTVQVKAVIDKWLLLTYDIPNDGEGPKARYEFLQRARIVGAVQHTESVYIMPWTSTATALAIELGMIKNAKVYAWYSEATDPKLAAEMTAMYDGEMVRWLDEINVRLGKSADHLKQDHAGVAGRMLEHTISLLNDLEGVVERRGNPAFKEQLDKLRLAAAAQMAEAGV